MSQQIQKEVRSAVANVIESELPFDKHLSTEEKQYLVDHGTVRHVEEGEVLCEQHQVDNKLYIIVMGEVEVSEEHDGEHLVLAHLGKGELFGEIAAMFKTPRISTVRVSKPSVLLELHGEVLEKLVSNNPDLYDAVITRYRKRLTDTALRSVSLFRYLPDKTLQSLKQNSSIVTVPTGGVIVKEGEPGDAMYIIIYGTARVSHLENNRRLNLAILQSGDYFGEWSLLTGAPRTATVSALTQVDMVRVDCGPFLQFIQNNPDVRDRIDLVAHNRHEQTEYLEHIHSTPTELSTMFQNFDNVSVEKTRDSSRH